jgi:regulatory protein YycI of two-component signal transduction system YycFG
MIIQICVIVIILIIGVLLTINFKNELKDLSEHYNEEINEVVDSTKNEILVLRKTNNTILSLAKYPGNQSRYYIDVIDSVTGEFMDLDDNSVHQYLESLYKIYCVVDDRCDESGNNIKVFIKAFDEGKDGEDYSLMKAEELLEKLQDK